MRQVIGHEAGDEVVAVVVAGLHAQRQRVAGLVARGLQQLGPEVLGQILRSTLVCGTMTTDGAQYMIGFDVEYDDV